MRVGVVLRANRWAGGVSGRENTVDLKMSVGVREFVVVHVHQ